MKRLNTPVETAQLEAARHLFCVERGLHLNAWLKECGCECDQYRARCAILARDQKERQLEIAAAELREYGYAVNRPRQAQEKRLDLGLPY